MRAIVREVVSDLKYHWKSLVATDIVYKLIAFLVLAPLAAYTLRALLSLSGNSMLADQDIVFFLLGPTGWVTAIVLGAIWLAIIALELAALMAILHAPADQPAGVVSAIRFATGSAPKVLHVAARVMGWAVVVTAPFALIAFAVYRWLLTDYDINYYLQQRPPEFLWAVGIGALLVITLAAIAARLTVDWFFALPTVLLEDVRPSESLRQSRARVDGHRREILLWIVCWIAISAAASTATSWLVVQLGRSVVPLAADSLSLLSLTIGAMLVLWAAINGGLNIVSTVVLGSLHYHLYQHFGSAPSQRESRELRIPPAPLGPGFLRMTPIRLAAGLVLLVAASCGVGILTTRDVRISDDVVIIAHRGASADAPENTLMSIKGAIEQETDWVEIDVQETADGEVVVIHDSDFMKLAGNELKLWNATLGDLEAIDIGSWFDRKFAGQRVPTLTQVLQLCRDQAGVTIELKYYGHDQQLERRVVEIVERERMADQVQVMSLKYDAVQKMRSLRPAWQVGLLMSVSAGGLNRIDADFLAVNASFVDRSFVRRAHASGKLVYVWTVNDPATMSSMIGRGVDGLITDVPAVARSVLRERAEMGVTERILLELADDFGVPPKVADQ